MMVKVLETWPCRQFHPERGRKEELMDIVNIPVYLSNLLIAEGRAKGWLLVSRPWLHLNSHVHDGRNTQYLNTRIVLDDLQPWDATFPTYDDIFQFSQSTPHLRQRFHEEEIGDPSFLFQTRFMTAPMVFDEQDLAAAGNEFYVHLNYLLRLATDTGIEGQNFIMVGGGRQSCETPSIGWRRKVQNPRQDILLDMWCLSTILFVRTPRY